MGFGYIIYFSTCRELPDQASRSRDVTGENLIPASRLPVLRAVTWAYSRLRIGESPRTGLRILMYHAIGTLIEGDVRSLYNMTPALFEMHVHFLRKRYKDQIVPLVSPELKGDSLGIALTFDDGYRDNLSVAAPLLVELGIPFTVFVCTGAVAGRKAGFLDPNEVRELAGLPGVKIGSHCVEHVRLTECGERRLNEELAGSKAYLEDLLGSEIDSLSYPHGAVNRRVRDVAARVGYRIGASSRFDINQPGRDPLLLCRTDIWAGDDLSIFEQKLRGEWDWMRWCSSDCGWSTA